MHVIITTTPFFSVSYNSSPKLSVLVSSRVWSLSVVYETSKIGRQLIHIPLRINERQNFSYLSWFNFALLFCRYRRGLSSF